MAVLLPRRAGSPPPFSPRAPRSVSLFFATIATLILFCAHVSAQKNAPETDEVIRVETNLLTLPVFVTDSSGRRVQGLTRDDFSLRGNDTRVEIAYFASGAERVALAFLLDASGSTRDIITQQRETALALFARFGKSSCVAVMRFWDQPKLTVPFTTDQTKVQEAFLLPALPNRRTAIFDAALAAVRAYEKSETAPTERRIVILISDGLDTASTTRARTVIEEALARDVSFYVIHLPLYAPRDGRLVPRSTAKGFRELAKETGGQFFTVGDAEDAINPRAARYDLAPVFQAIADDLRGQYVLGFYGNNLAANTSPSERRIDIKLSLTKQRKLRIRSLRSSFMLRK